MTRTNEADLPNTQSDLFGAPPPQSYTPTLETVRAEVHKVLDQARSATVMPWNPKDVSYWRLVFPQMTNWLPADEAKKLRFEFEAELERLLAA